MEEVVVGGDVASAAAVGGPRSSFTACSSLPRPIASSRKQDTIRTAHLFAAPRPRGRCKPCRALRA
eukprot:13028836-Alexandrium_andersonii.AAC.1